MRVAPDVRSSYKENGAEAPKSASPSKIGLLSGVGGFSSMYGRIQDYADVERRTTDPPPSWKRCVVRGFGRMDPCHDISRRGL